MGEARCARFNENDVSNAPPAFFSRKTILSDFSRVSILIEHHLAVLPLRFGFDFIVRPLVEFLHYLNFEAILAQTDHTGHQAGIILCIAVFFRGIDPATFPVSHEGWDWLHIGPRRGTARPEQGYISRAKAFLKGLKAIRI